MRRPTNAHVASSSVYIQSYYYCIYLPVLSTLLYINTLGVRWGGCADSRRGDAGAFRHWGMPLAGYLIPLAVLFITTYYYYYYYYYYYSTAAGPTRALYTRTI